MNDNKVISLTMFCGGRSKVEEFSVPIGTAEYEIADECYARALNFGLSMSSIPAYENLPYSGFPMDYSPILATLDYDYKVVTNND